MSLEDTLYSEYRPDAVSGGTWGPTNKRDAVGVEINKGVKLGPETSWHYFHPNRVDIRFAPDHFRSKLKEIDPRLECVWHPIKERWAVWFKNPNITFWMCPGWRMLFFVAYPDGSYMPLDNRTLAEAWSRNPKVVGKGKEYFESVVDQMAHDKKVADAKLDDERDWESKEYYRFGKIKNIGRGNKFGNHYAAGG